MKLRSFGRKSTELPSWDRPRAHSAHTLIELLAVIGILVLLAALYLTVLSGAKAKGLQTQCANNLRQLGIALQQFASENQGYPFVMENINSPSGFPKDAWDHALGTYTGGFRENTSRKPYQPAGVFHCPAANPPTCPTFPEGVFYYDYGYNAFGISGLFDTNRSLGLSPWMGNTTNQATPLPVSSFEVDQPIRESQIASPADMMAVGDAFAGNRHFLCDAVGSLWRSESVGADYPPGSTGRAYSRHREKTNVVFCDAHVEGPRLKALFADDTDTALKRWNRDDRPHRERLIH